jgi:signal transduction histidine kinase
VLFSLRDDGAGFDVAAVKRHGATQSLGLLGIEERVDALGGTLQIESNPGNGTALLIAVPVGSRGGATDDADARAAGG